LRLFRPQTSPGGPRGFDQAAKEFVAAQRFNADGSEARTALANFCARRGLAADADAEYRAALRLNPQYVTAAINLADPYRQLGRDNEGEEVLHAGIAASPRETAAHHARTCIHKAQTIGRSARGVSNGDGIGAA